MSASVPQAGGAEPSEPASLLDSLGAEITRIVAPVSACMLLVVLLVSTLSSPSSLPPNLFSLSPSSSSSSSSSIWDNISQAVLGSVAFVVLVAALTFLLVLLFYLRCTRCLKAYMTFSAFVVLSILGGQISLLLISHFAVPLDPLTFFLLLANFSVVGVVAVSAPKMPIVVTQSYLVIIGVLVAYWFTLLPEWTTWALLVAMALYDLAAVLLPVGPLRLLVELAISRDEEIPALVYEARPVEPIVGARRGVWRARVGASGSSQPSSITVPSDSNANVDSNSNNNSGNGSTTLGELVVETRLVIAEEEELTAPLIHPQPERGEEDDADGIGLGSSGAIKLGLGDFIFYSVLVGRAAMYDFMTVYACYLAIIAGLGITLMLLAFYRKALPALPVSVLLGVFFYVLTRTLLEVFVVQCSTNLLMF